MTTKTCSQKDDHCLTSPKKEQYQPKTKCEMRHCFTTLHQAEPGPYSTRKNHVSTTTWPAPWQVSQIQDISMLLWHDIMSIKRWQVNEWVGRITSSPAWCSNKTPSHHATPFQVGRPDQSLKPKCRSCRPRWQSLLRDTRFLQPYQVPSQVSSIPPKFQHHKVEDTWQLASSQPAEQQRQHREQAKNSQLVFNTDCLISRK